MSVDVMRPWNEVFEDVKRRLGQFMTLFLGFETDYRGVYCGKICPEDYQLLYSWSLKTVLERYGYDYFANRIRDTYIRRVIMGDGLRQIYIPKADREWFEYTPEYRMSLCNVPDAVEHNWCQIYEWVSFQNIYVDPEELRIYIDERCREERLV